MFQNAFWLLCVQRGIEHGLDGSGLGHWSIRDNRNKMNMAQSSRLLSGLLIQLSMQLCPRHYTRVEKKKYSSESFATGPKRLKLPDVRAGPTGFSETNHLAVIWNWPTQSQHSEVKYLMANHLTNDNLNLTPWISFPRSSLVQKNGKRELTRERNSKYFANVKDQKEKYMYFE